MIIAIGTLIVNRDINTYISFMSIYRASCNNKVMFEGKIVEIFTGARVGEAEEVLSWVLPMG